MKQSHRKHLKKLEKHQLKIAKKYRHPAFDASSAYIDLDDAIDVSKASLKVLGAPKNMQEFLIDRVVCATIHKMLTIEDN